MDEDEKLETEADDLTPDEQEIEDETDTSGEEAHRIGEFDDLRDRLERIETVLGNITSTLEAMRTTAAAIDIDNGGRCRRRRRRRCRDRRRRGRHHSRLRRHGS